MIDYNEKVKLFKQGFISIKDLIKSLEVDLIDKDIEDLKEIIKEYENE